MKMQRNFTVSSNGINKLFYEDMLCRAELTVADFRDSSWGISLEKVINKNNREQIKLTKKQEYELFRRISADSRTELYTDEFDFILEDISNIDNTSVLDV